MPQSGRPLLQALPLSQVAIFRLPRQEASESARTRSWEKAERNARKKEREYEARELATRQGQQVKQNDSQPKTIDIAVELYLEDKRQQNCAEETLTKLETLFKKQFAE